MGDGLLMLEEWTAERLTKIRLPNHDVFRLAASTLEPVAAMGDTIIVSNYATGHARNLVVAAVADRFLARRYNEMEAHPDIAVLTGQSVDPSALAEPVIAGRRNLNPLKIVGTLFTASKLHFPADVGVHEIVPIDDEAQYWNALEGARLFKVLGRSAEPIAIEGQYLITRDAVAAEQTPSRFDGQLVVAVDNIGATYFKRLRFARRPFVILESMNPDGSAAPELLSLKAGLICQC